MESCFQSSEAIATDIATGMAVSLLFVLCNPWAGRPEVRPRDPPPPPPGLHYSHKSITLYLEDILPALDIQRAVRQILDLAQNSRISMVFFLHL